MSEEADDQAGPVLEAMELAAGEAVQVGDRAGRAFSIARLTQALHCSSGLSSGA
jgi:hypothetical protein